MVRIHPQCPHVYGEYEKLFENANTFSCHTPHFVGCGVFFEKNIKQFTHFYYFANFCDDPLPAIDDKVEPLRGLVML